MMACKPGRPIVNAPRPRGMVRCISQHNPWVPNGAVWLHCMGNDKNGAAACSRQRERNMSFRARLAALACALSFLCVSAQAATTAEVSRGLDWLQAQIAADGSLVGETSSVATSAQIRTEVTRTLRELGRETPASLLQSLAPDTEQSTEVASRAALAVQPGGQAASDWVAALVARRLADGSMPALLGYGSTDLDMAWALRAMAGQPAAASLVQALASRQQPDGSWNSTPYSPLHVSALVLCGLSPYASSNADAANAVSRAATYVIGQRLADRSWSPAACRLPPGSRHRYMNACTTSCRIRRITTACVTGWSHGRRQMGAGSKTPSSLRWRYAHWCLRHSRPGTLSNRVCGFASWTGRPAQPCPA